MPNRYIKRGKRPVLPHPFDPTLAIVQLTKGYQAVVSAIDAPAVAVFNWCALVVKSGGVYGMRRQVKGDKAILLHRFVAGRAGIDTSREIDHRDGNGLNCARSNLRPATHQQNAANRRLSKSGTRGVRWIENRKKWWARVGFNGKTIHVGYFLTEEGASVAASAARTRLFGEFGNRTGPRA